MLPQEVPEDDLNADSATPEQQGTINNQKDLASLAPIFLVRQVVDDWFELVHPVAPVLHRETFLRQLEDISRHDNEFVCLVVSVCAATVTTLRRRTLEYAATITVEKCHSMIRDLEQTHGTLRITLMRCQTKYNMAVALGSENGMDNLDSQLLLAEATAMVGRVIHYEMQGLHLHDRELIKRLYWLCFAAQW